jgi:hypothetical protein
MNKEETYEMVSVVLDELEQHEWYANIIYYLKNLACPDHLVDYKRRAMRLKASKYCMIKEALLEKSRWF